VKRRKALKGIRMKAEGGKKDEGERMKAEGGRMMGRQMDKGKRMKQTLAACLIFHTSSFLLHPSVSPYGHSLFLTYFKENQQ